MSLYGVTTTLKDKIEEVHAKLVDETDKFGKMQRKAKKQGGKISDQVQGNPDINPRQGVHFASEIPGNPERSQRHSNDEPTGSKCESESARFQSMN